MSEEEKKAMDWLSALDINSEYEAISKEIILSLIEEQQKEIEKLTKKYKNAKEMYIVKDNSLKNYIHKDKIRDEIEFLKKPREVTLIDEKGNSKKVMYEEIYNDTIKILEKILEE